MQVNLLNISHMKRKYIPRHLLLFGLAAIFMQGCNKESDKSEASRNVIVAEVSALSADGTINYPGVIEEGASISAAFMAEGKIAKISVKEGDRVRKGQLLATLDDSDYRIGVAQLEAQFEQMSKEKQRMDAMYEKHNIAPNDYEKFTTGYEQLRLQVEMARKKMGYTRLYSPSDGYIAVKYMSEGELVGAGTPVFNIIDDSRLMATLDLPVGAYIERDRIKKIEGSVPGIAGRIPLSMVSFTPEAENNMLYRMKLAVPVSVARDLTPGMNISVWIMTSDSAKAETMVPSRAIFSEGGNTYVWAYNEKDSTIHKRPVAVTGSPEGKLSVVKGLDIGEKIVETGVKQLFEGEKVNVLNRKDIGF